MSQALLLQTAAGWKIPRETAIAVIARDENCIYCGVIFQAPYTVRSTCPSWEHIVNDLALVGLENIGLCCVSCNASKGVKTLSQWLSSAYCRKKSITSSSLSSVASAALSRGQGITMGSGLTEEENSLVASAKLDSDELAQLTYSFLGRFFVEFARLELNLTLRVGEADRFSDKVSLLRKDALNRLAGNQRSSEVCIWCDEADSLRKIRNRFAHGRWGFDPFSQSVIHVEGYPPAMQNELRFSRGDLDAKVRAVIRLDEQLAKLMRHE